LSWSPSTQETTVGPPKVDQVDFDVAVTAVEGKGTKGGIGVFVGAVGLGSLGESNVSSSTVSRIRFSVRVRLPADAES
jgi:hypothetical protein